MYPQISNDLPESRCPKCHLLRVACLCQKVPELKSAAVFFLLVHQRELAKGSNTGHLVFNAMANADYELWARTEPPAKLLALLNSPKHQGYLLFTAEEGTPLVEDIARDQSSSDKIPVCILIDSTWQQARKMVRQSPYLKCLPRLSLSPTSKSQYRLRRNQLDIGMSTCEAAIGLLEQLGESKNAEYLEQYFLDFMRHFDASMSGHGVD